MVVVSVPATVISFFEGSYCYIIRTDFCFVESYLCPYFNYEKDVDGVCVGVWGAVLRLRATAGHVRRRTAPSVGDPGPPSESGRRSCSFLIPMLPGRSFV
jgi:hypothetical protein